MLPIYSSKELKFWDHFTMKTQAIDSIDLMERAAIQFVNWFIEKFQPNDLFLIFCGNGNNGGDGLAIARLLVSKLFRVKVVLVKVGEHNSPDYEINLSKVRALGIEQISSRHDLVQLFAQSTGLVIIDAILGYGLNRDLDDNLLNWIQFINESKHKVVAVDVPSGMFVDKITDSDCIHAQFTFTFQSPKLSQLIAETGKYCGELSIGNINLDSEFIKYNPPNLNYLEQNDISEIYSPRSLFNWKNKYGHLLIIGGNKGMAGAIILSANSSLRSGCGLCSIYSEESNREIIQISLPEAIFVQTNTLDLSKYSCLVAGPGMGLEMESKNKLYSILSSFNKPMVLDADALNIIAMENWQSSLNNNCIVTPHVGEFDRLFGPSSNGFERLKKAIEFSSQFKIHIILKGKFTAVISPDKKVFFNSTGNPGLAKGGSGDVLSGMLGSFLAQGYSILDACKLAVYIHGMAADIAKEKIAEESIFPSDVIKNISNAFLKINL